MKGLLAGLVLVLSSLFVFTAPVSAQQTVNCPDGSVVTVGPGAAGVGLDELCAANGQCEKGSFLGLPVWYKYLDLKADGNGGCSVELPKTMMVESDGTQKEVTDWPKAVGYISIAVVEILLRLASLVAVAFVIYGGFRYITSQGEPDNAKSARQTIINALVGLVITIAAASIVSFIANRLTS